ncbi:MAG TPA: protein-L-isoaspartate(D-aspartate) O-methyltransferase [Solirubrobacteraceae bacterium]|jgi:protein-L-isoaspartate(D-aspartate) O-methyltransferase|nr:protein-L-isoaspartate(D-aspartate) O-methyltransferase [Solirubrobacteraceae bacterium]
MTEASSLADLLRPAIKDDRVLRAIASVPRERFVPAGERARAYENVALPIGCGQTISQPLVVARMLELLELGPDDRVLDVGTGSGYHAALLARLAAEVWTIERHAELSAEAERAIRGLGIDNVHLVVGDGAAGLPQRAPYDAINVAAAAGASVPARLEQQLAPGGRLVAPVGVDGQRLTLIRRTERGLEAKMLEPVRFVPLISNDQ